MDKLLFSILFISHIGFLQAQYTLVPDPNFEQALIDLGIDSEGVLDGQFLTTDALGITVLDVKEKNISDLTGLEAFVDLHDLWATNNNLTSVDLSMLPNATIWTVSLSNNNISSIDVSPISRVVNLLLTGNNLQNVEVIDFSRLYVLGASNQDITSITLQNCPNLQVLEFANTSLTSINLSECPNLRSVQCQNSQFQSLDFTYNQNLEYLLAYNLPLTSINLPNNPNLEELYIHSCQLTELNVASCTALWYLNCSSNYLTTLDLSGNPNLEDLRCYDNQLTALDVSSNPNLIKVICLNNIIEDIVFNNNHSLDTFTCRSNLITTLDLSTCSVLNTVQADDNPYLEIVNLKNGGNSNMNSFSAYNCPNLTCVVVDDPLAPNDNISPSNPHPFTFVGDIADCEGIYIPESILQNQIGVFPNPVESLFVIRNDSSSRIESISFFDVFGKRIISKQTNFHHIDVSNFCNGIYVLEITTNKGVIAKKIIKN